MKTFAKTTLGVLYKYTGMMATQERIQHWAGQHFLSVLLFHRVTDAIAPDGITVGTEYFRELCGRLRGEFNVVPLAELLRILKSGESPPMRTVALTFDDCYRDNLFAARVMAEHGLPACFFLPTAYVGTGHVFNWDRDLPPMPNLTWDDVQEMVHLGHDIGSHTVTHPDMAQVGLEQARQELAQSKKTLEDRLGRPVRWFAYPFGGAKHFSPERLPLVFEQGYEACLSAEEGFIYPGMAGQILPRIPVPCYPSLAHFELYLTGCLSWWFGLKRRIRPPSEEVPGSPMTHDPKKGYAL